MRKLVLVLGLAFLAGCGGDTGISTGVVIAFQTATTGQNLDDEYFVTLNIADTIGTIGANAQAVFGLAEGLWTFGLEGVAANCTVAGDNPRDLEAVLPELIVLFEVSCI